MCRGFERGTISTIAFRAKAAGFAHSLSLLRLVGSAMFAEANTSAGAPSLICAARALEPANENLAERSILGNALVSEEAAKTVRSELPAVGWAEAPPTAVASSTSAPRARFTGPAPS